LAAESPQRNCLPKLASRNRCRSVRSRPRAVRGRYPGFFSSGRHRVGGFGAWGDYLFWLVTWTLPSPGPLPPMNMNVSGASNWTRIETPPNALLAINGEITDPSRTFESYAKRFRALSPGRLERSSIPMAVSPGYTGLSFSRCRSRRRPCSWGWRAYC
jgi:hypothetical protein